MYLLSHITTVTHVTATPALCHTSCPSHSVTITADDSDAGDKRLTVRCVVQWSVNTQVGSRADKGHPVRARANWLQDAEGGGAGEEEGEGERQT